MIMAGDKPCFVSRGDARDQSSCCHFRLGACLIELDNHTVRVGLSAVNLAAAKMLWGNLFKM
jgi:hypothetical protein